MKLLLRYIVWIIIVFLCALPALAQTHLIDSLRNELKKSPEDSIALFLNTSLGNEYFAYDTAIAKQYMEKGYLIAKKMNWDYALGDYYQIKAMSKQFSSDHELAHIFFDSAIFYFKKTINSNRPEQEVENAKLAMATSMGQIADILLKRGRSGEAIAAFIAAMEAWRASNDPRKNEAIAVYYTKISTAYYELKEFDKALSYDKLALAAILTGNNEESIAWEYTYLVGDFIALNQNDSSLKYLQKVKPIIERLNNHRLNVEYYNKLGQISSAKKEYREAIEYYEKCVAEAKMTNAKFHVLSNQRMIGVSYVLLGEYASARTVLLIALPAAIAGNYAKEKMLILEELATVEEKTNHPAEAYNYLKQSVALRDSVNQENSKKEVAEIENKYQAAEKAKEIIQLNAGKQIQALSIKQKSTLNYFLIASLVALMIVGFLVFRNLRNRQLLAKQQDELQQQRIRELEKDKQLVAVDSMLKGQEEERSRLAKDLHDGLGGLLSGVKFSLSNMKDNLIITPDNMAVFERSLDMIDTSIQELRRVAHNMMPEMLTKFGLDEALKEYCNTINAAKLLLVKYQSHGMEVRLEKSAEIIVYRIIQELLNNILKHAVASETFIQLIRDDNRLNVVVEDNGKGFDTALTENSKGAGWMNIRSRVDYLKGQLDIHSGKDKGTLVNIEFNV
ncbi:MAG: sensor histidine kinase [Bacteroidia bacterium]|nr:sensor histidine kinase [Bacteroidia bacterium]